MHSLDTVWVVFIETVYITLEIDLGHEKHPEIYFSLPKLCQIFHFFQTV